MNPIVKHFAEAGLDLELAAEPIRDVGNSDIVQLDIAAEREGNRFHEYFRLWSGSPANRIMVLGKNRTLRQLVFMVHEPRREFLESHWIGNGHRFEDDATMNEFLEANQLQRKEVVRIDGHEIVLRRFTESSKAHYLCGHDERHLFIAGLPEGVSTVHDAHQLLLPEALTDRNGLKASKVLRQGEWFFVPVSDREAADAARRFVEVPARNVVLGFSRNPHVAEEFVAGGPHGVVRGKVRHPDHATLKLRTWHRVYRNQDSLQPGTGGPSRLSLAIPNWVD